MADDDHGARIVRQMVLQPQRAFEVEIVGRLVQQQQIGRRKQRRRQRHAHPPAAGKFRAGPRLVRGRKSEAAEDRGRARRRRMGVDVDQPGLDFGDPVRIVRRSRLRAAARRARGRPSARRRSGFPARPALPARGCRCASAAECAMLPVSVGSSPRIAWNSVDLPTPLRPTKPTRAPGTICTVLWSIRSRPAMRTEISVMESMRRCHRSRRQTQPCFFAGNIASHADMAQNMPCPEAGRRRFGAVAVHEAHRCCCVTFRSTRCVFRRRPFLCLHNRWRWRRNDGGWWRNLHWRRTWRGRRWRAADRGASDARIGRVREETAGTAEKAGMADRAAPRSHNDDRDDNRDDSGAHRDRDRRPNLLK